MSDTQAAATIQPGNTEDVANEADNEAEEHVAMIIDDANDHGAEFDAAMAILAQEDINAAPHIASAATDAAAGQALPNAISPRAQPHPLVDANHQYGGPTPVGNGVLPFMFMFADPQQAAAHFAGAANNTAPMYVFGAQDGNPMVVGPAPEPPSTLMPPQCKALCQSQLGQSLQALQQYKHSSSEAPQAQRLDTSSPTSWCTP
jgi:hypothetical protein